MRRTLLAALAALLLAVPGSAQVYQGKQATPVITVDTGGTYVAPGGGGASTVTGNVASGATDTGNPVKIGCPYATSPTAVATGQRVDVNCTATGAVKIGGVSVNGDSTTGNVAFVSAPDGTPVALGTFGYILGNTGLSGYRQVSAGYADTRAADGVPAAGVVGWDGAAYRRLCTDSLGRLCRTAAFLENTASIGSSATFNGTARDAGSADRIGYSWFTCYAVAPTASATLLVQFSDDSATWTAYDTSASTALASGVPKILTYRVMARYQRCQVVNGATGQAVYVRSSYNAD